MMRFYCNGKHGVCDKTHCPDDCAFFDGLSGKTVDIIICEECEHHGYDEEIERHWCHQPLGCMGCIPVEPTDFCSRAKKKEESKDEGI
ncbi:MAG: hypothetical protein IKY91_08320 [Akkermansia sp.]|nr:hypothetical protein [Akkermansia sp.]